MINCAEMKAKIEKRIEERQASRFDEIKRWQERYANSKEEWWTQHGPAWERAVKRMSEALEAGEPITSDMIPGTRYDDATWSPPTGKPMEEYQPPEAVTMLLAAMEMHDGEEISTSELARLGIGSDHMRNVTRFLSKGWG